MKRLLILVVLLLAITGIVYAQTPRHPDNLEGRTLYIDHTSDTPDTSRYGKDLDHQTYLASAGTTVFTNVAAVGLEATGNPAYIALAGPAPSTDTEYANDEYLYYLWVNKDGELLMASASTLAQYSSFPTGDWRKLDDEYTGINTVGEQS